jgi:hypothetical protein
MKGDKKRFNNMKAQLVSMLLTCFVLFCFLIAKQLDILRILNNLKHATDRVQIPSSP